MQFVSNSLFKATPLFEGSGEIRFLNSTCCVPGLMKATCHPGKCRAICSIFFLSKDNTCSQRSPPGVVPSRTRAPIVECWTVLNHHDGSRPTELCVLLASSSPRWYFASEHCAERPTSEGFLQTPVSDFLKISVKGVHPCCGYSNIVFPQRNIFGAHPWWVTVASFSLNTSLINAMWFQQCLLSYIF